METTQTRVENTFQTGQVMTIVGGHFIHDTFTAFVAPLLPDLIERFSLTFTQAGLLSAMIQIPSLINPLIGYLADRVSLRYFVIFAPATTALFISVLGLAPGPVAIAILLLLAGTSAAVFHAPAPPMVARISGKELGRGMSYFMAGGELARSVGPLLLAWSVSIWGLEGYWRVMALGWLTTLILYWRLREIPARSTKSSSLREMLPAARRLFAPLFIFVLLRIFMTTSLSTFLPTLMTTEGATRLGASATLSIYEIAGVGGALLVGPLSDRVGRKKTLLAVTLTAPVLMISFLLLVGWMRFFILGLLGFVVLAASPILLAIVQEGMPDNRAVANGIYLTITFLSRPAASVLIGLISDQFGLRVAFFGCALIPLLSIPALLLLPDPQSLRQ